MMPAAAGQRAVTGLALSGGGRRAALFGLGALHYLVTSGRASSLDTITSVSGGSYVNALASTTKWERSDFEASFRPFVAAMAHGSVLSDRGLRRAVTRTFGISLPALIPIVTRGLPRIAGLCVRGSSVALAIKRYPDVGNALANAIRSRLYPDPPARLGEESGTLHVLCATNLNTADFSYLTNRFTHVAGVCTEGAAKFAVAVDASTALPPIIQPIEFELEDGRSVLLADGGLHDNTALEWFQRSGVAGPCAPSRNDGLVLAIDGSPPVRVQQPVRGTRLAKRRTPWWWITAGLRGLQLATSNWARRRVDRAQRDPADGTIALSLAMSPRDEIEGRQPTSDQQEALRRLGVNWDRVVKRSLKSGGWVRPLGEKKTVNLLYHGYVLAWSGIGRIDAQADLPVLPDLDEYRSIWFSDR